MKHSVVLLLWSLWATTTTTATTAQRVEMDEMDDFDWSELSSDSGSDDDADSVVRLLATNFYEKTVGKRVFVKFYDPM